MADKPPLFVRVSLPHGHFTVPRVTAERAGWTVLKQDAVDTQGRPLPSIPREVLGSAGQRETTKKSRAKRAAKRLRGDAVAASPTIEPGTVSGDTSKE